MIHKLYFVVFLHISLYIVRLTVLVGHMLRRRCYELVFCFCFQCCACLVQNELI